jgi:hypothetical protein
VAKDVPEAVRWYRRAAVARPKLQSVIRHCRVSQIPVVRHYHRITWYAGLALLAYHTATVPFSFRWQAALLFVGVISGTALVGSVVVPWLWPARWKATAEEFGFALLAWPPKYVLGFVLQIASEDGFFLVPLLHVGISVPLAIVTGAGFGCAHYGPYGLPMSAVKGAAYVLVALFVLPSGIWSVIAGHLIVDVIAFGFDRRGSIKDMCSKFPP